MFSKIILSSPALVDDGISHMEGTSVTSSEFSFPNIRALSSHQMIVTDGGGKQVSCTTVGAGAGPATRLRVLTTVGVEVSVTKSIHDTKDATISVDSFNILTIVPVQSVTVISPTRASRVQTYDQEAY